MPTTSPTASPAINQVIGVENFVIAPLTADTASGATYGTLQLVTGAIELSITPGNADATKQYYDNIEGTVIYPDPELTFKTKMADLPLSIQAMILSNKLDDNGVLVRTAGDQPPYFACGFKSLMSNGKYRYAWLYKCRAKPFTETSATKEGTSVTLQTQEVEWTAIKRTYDGRYHVVADEGMNGFTSAMASTFLNSVYTANFDGVSLSALSITAGSSALTLSPTFSSGTLTYTTTATGSTATVTYTLMDSSATATVKNGDTAAGSGGSVTLATGVNDINVTVTKGSNSQVYHVYITKTSA